jgi:hypothetical protein
LPSILSKVKVRAMNKKRKCFSCLRAALQLVFYPKLK